MPDAARRPRAEGDRRPVRAPATHGRRPGLHLPAPAALVVVDVQGTFADDVPGAGLPVPGSGRTVAAIREFTVHAARLPSVVTVVTSQDWHPADLPGHFAPPGTSPDPAHGLFPPHGVAGTPQAELHPRFATPELVAVLTDRVRKGQAGPGYSAFDGVDDRGRPLDAILAAAGIRSVVVYGWELAHCVAASALGATARGLATTVVPELCSVLDPHGRPGVLRRLRRHGVHVASSTRALASLAAAAP